MSLRAFHIIFIVISTLLSFGFGYWGLMPAHAVDRATFYFALLSLAVGVALVFYLFWFIRKVRAPHP